MNGPVKTLTRPAPAWATLAALAAAGCGGGDGPASEDEEAPGETTSALLDPAALAETAPETFHARFETSKGVFVIEVDRAWAPLGADRFYALVKNGFYDGVRFFRVVEGFVVQFGIHGDPNVSAVWRNARFPDDSAVVASNTRGTVTYAKSSAPNSRTTQIFVNYGDNSRLDEDGFAPFGRVVEGMEVLDQLHSGYGGTPSQNQPLIQAQGNAYLHEHFPELDYVVSATVVESAGRP